MDDEDKPQKGKFVELSGDLSEFSLGDIDERVGELEAEIERLKAERKRKEGSLSAAESFFKK